MNRYASLALAAALSITAATAQTTLNLQEQTLPNPDNVPAPVHPIPHPRQLKWQETEYYAFFHYGMNTYTGLEWGMGDEDRTTFAPTAPPNPRQWLEVAKAAGMPYINGQNTVTYFGAVLFSFDGE